MYYITLWDNKQVRIPTLNLTKAKVLARSLGHTGQSNGIYLAPVAFVANEAGQCEYNPRFKVGKDDDYEPITIEFVQVRCGLEKRLNERVRII